MLINEVSQETHLSKKAIEYYVEKQLVCPPILDNGYRDFSQVDIEVLKKISVLRKLGLGVGEIKEVLADKTGEKLHRISTEKALAAKKEQQKELLLNKLIAGKSYAEVAKDIQALDAGSTITEKMLDTFPGYMGRFFSLHFARFLNMPITSPDQQVAYDEIVHFFDNVQTLALSEELQDYMVDSTKLISTDQMTLISEAAERSIGDIDQFMQDNKDFINEYAAIKQSDEYKQSHAGQLQEAMKAFTASSGYNDVFLPAIRRLSPSYAAYSEKIKSANDQFLAAYPQYAELN